MKLPQLIDYQQALQVPQVSFVDMDLKQGRVQLNQLRVPDPASGGFALTFSVATANGRFAVRCFHKLGNHLQERYFAIAEFIRGNRYGLRFLSNVDYVPKGILVNGGFFPIVRMPWIDGIRLDSWVDQHLNRPDDINHVRTQLTDAVTRMRAAGIAHGDLQHGNILVDSARTIWLVDYDGMFLPSLAELGTSEFGHRNYQHPDRGAAYNQDLDCFASFVIDLSLDAVSQDPTLWRATGENLIFEADDFASPERSEVFARLSRMPRLSDRTRRLMDTCAADFNAVPAILSGERMTSRIIRPAASGQRRTAMPTAVSALDRETLIGRVGDEVTVVGQVINVKRFDRGTKTTFINFGDYREAAFTIVAFDQISRELLSTFGAKLEPLKGSWVALTGLVTQYQSAWSKDVTPQIELRRVRSLRLVNQEQAEAMLAPPTVQQDEPPAPARTVRDEQQPAPSSMTYRQSTPRKQRLTADDIDVRASKLYSMPGFVTKPAESPAAASTPPPAAATPNSSVYRISNPRTLTPPATPRSQPQAPPPPSRPRPQPQTPPPPAPWQHPQFVSPQPPAPVRRSLWKRLRDRLGL